MFKWDGSDITEFIKKKEVKIYEGENNNKTYWIIEDTSENNNRKEVVLVRSSQNILPCLIDELKNIFNLVKIGTHWLKLHSKIYIILKTLVEKGGEEKEKEEKEKTEKEKTEEAILDELTLDHYKYDKNIETEVQKIFLFRELLGLTMNFEKNIILRKYQLHIQPISFYEANMKPGNSGKVLPGTVLDKWFKKTDLDTATCKFFNIDKIENMNEVLLELKGKLEETFLRVDPSSIMNVDEILTRIRSRLQFILS